MSRHSPSDRARVRVQAGTAGAIVHAAWPLRTFVAVNPLGGLQDRPLETAVGLAGPLLGLRGRPSLAWFRGQYDRGRVTDADLDGALHRRLPGLADRAPVVAGPRSWTAAEILRADLLRGDAEPAGERLPRGAAEWCDLLLGTSIAATIDEQVAKWCTAFFDTQRARWAMPGRERGLYGAWRALVVDDPAVRRMGLAPKAFADAPTLPEDALLDALDALRIPEPERRAELRAQIARLPGWAAAVKWRGEHPDQAPHPADLVDLLAIRMTYEAHAVAHAAGEVLTQGVAGLRALVEQHLADAAAAPDPVGRAARAEAVADALPGADVDPAALHATLDLLPAADRGWVWLDAYEWHYRDRLLTQLDRPAPPDRGARPDAQAVFCIDARSEGLRRHLEAAGAYETFGFAGFFQLVMRYRALASTHEARLCPVPLTPGKTITERPAGGQEERAARSIDVDRQADALAEAFHGAKDELAAPFALADAAGWLAGPLAAARTVAPRWYTGLRGRLERRTPAPATDLTVDTPDPEAAEELVAQAERQAIRALLGLPALAEEACEQRRVAALRGDDPELAERLELTPAAHAARVTRAQRLGYDLDEQVMWAEFALRSFGLVDGFARVVLLTGHGSHVENNAYEAALDCGACGGQRGGPNARIASAMLNREGVRAGLADRGIVVPDDTVFVAAEHDTATDRVTILDAHAIPESHRADVARLESALATAGEALAAERHARLPGADRPVRRAGDWAQVRPEWGLARHGAFVIGPGSMVSGLDLEARTFLHSYDAKADPDGSALETILTAPGLVVQWINAQYYFSAVDPDVLGAGDKTLHNVVGDVGVLEGHGGDLRLGLPWQSVAAGDELHHEPMRILFAVQAPRERVDALIARNDLLQHYFDGAWVALVVREGPEAPWQRRTAAGDWEPWTPADTPDPSPSTLEVLA